MTTPNQTPPPAFNGPALVELLKQLETGLPVRAELLEHMSRVLWLKYRMCIDRGFTDQQAMHLCTQDWGHAI